MNQIGVLRSGFVWIVLLSLACSPANKATEAEPNKKIRVLLDTDANNELDDQHAMAYLFFNGDIFDLAGITVNATRNGGDIDQQYQEAERVMKLCNVFGKIPLLRGANDSFAIIKSRISEPNFDGWEAVDFIIAEAHKKSAGKLVLLPVGKLTNIALALAKDPSISSRIRIVWLGSNYPEPGEYNLENDTASVNFVLNAGVQFEMVTVRYGKPSGTAAVSATREEVNRLMPGLGPKLREPVPGRHGGSFSNFGDYSVSLFKYIDTHDEAGTRALFDMAAVAILKNPGWAEQILIPAPVLIKNEWVDRPGHPHQIQVWENFNKEAIMQDFYDRMKQYKLVDRNYE